MSLSVPDHRHLAEGHEYEEDADKEEQVQGLENSIISVSKDHKVI